MGINVPAISTAKYDDNIYSREDGRHFPPKKADAEAKEQATELVNLDSIQAALENVNTVFSGGIDNVVKEIQSIAVDSDNAIKVGKQGIGPELENFTSGLTSRSIDANTEFGDVMGAAVKTFVKKYQEFYDTLQEKYNEAARAERDAYDARIRREREAANSQTPQ